MIATVNCISHEREGSLLNTRILNIILALVSAVGIGMLVRQRISLGSLRSEYERLGATHGIIDVKDPNKYHILSVISPEPKRHFLWRVYIPGGANTKVAQQIGNGSSSSSSTRPDPYDTLLRLRYIFEENEIFVHYWSSTSSGVSSIRGREVVEFFKAHWDELKFDVAETQVFNTHESAQLITIRLPDRLAELVKESTIPGLRKYSRNPIVTRVMIGNSGAVDEALDKARQAAK